MAMANYQHIRSDRFLSLIRHTRFLSTLMCLRSVRLNPIRIQESISRAIISAALSPIINAVLYVFEPTFPGQIDRSTITSITWIHKPAIFRFLVPYTSKYLSTTPASARGFIAQVPLNLVKTEVRVIH
jgi:hypothetical protein